MYQDQWSEWSHTSPRDNRNDESLSMAKEGMPRMRSEATTIDAIESSQSCGRLSMVAMPSSAAVS